MAAMRVQQTAANLGGYVVTVVCRGDQEAHVRALMLQGLTLGALHLRRLEQIMGRLSLEPTVTAARWRFDTLEE